MKHVLYGKCVKCGKTYDAVPDLTNCECGAFWTSSTIMTTSGPG